MNDPTIENNKKFESGNIPPVLSIMPVHEHNYLFPEPEPLAKGKLSDLPLDWGKNLEPIEKDEKELDKKKASTPGPDKEFFSFFTLSNYNIPIGANKPSIDLSENLEEK